MILAKSSSSCLIASLVGSRYISQDIASKNLAIQPISEVGGLQGEKEERIEGKKLW